MATKIKLGMIGLGGMGSHHANYISTMQDVQIVGVCDLIEEKARRVGEKLNVPWCLDYRQLLDQADAVWVCTEPFNRRDVVVTSIRAGKHIFTGKPVCLDLAQADEMIAAARAANVKYMLGYVLRFTEPYRTLRDTFASGELGELVSCWTRRFMPIDMSPLWYGKQENSGGVSLDFGSHDGDWLRWVGGDVKSVYGGVKTIRSTVKADEHAQAMLAFQAGGMGSFEVSWWSPVGESSVGIVGTKGAMIVGRDGVVRKRIDGHDEEIVNVDSAMDVNLGGKVGQRDGQGAIRAVATRRETIQEHFFRCIEEDIEPLTDASVGRAVLAVMNALQLSVQRGQSVNLSEIG
ncbi:MAG: Gfo/Idh/MocA family oxidoreductase [Planctomycetota bacterium]|nr:Gfo/Idh/MocA family oxidoreductase [Planctomycetota bacterium]